MATLNRIIINTVGASAYTNLLKDPDKFKDVHTYLTNLLDGPDGEDGSKKAASKLFDLMRENYNDLNSPITPAEISSLRVLGVDKEKDLLYFIIGKRSDNKTDIGTACGKALQEYYTELGYQVEEPYYVPDFIIDRTDPKKPFANPMRFLEKLASLVEDLERNHPGVRITINFTAGYKLNGIYSALVGMSYGCEVFYLQQEMNTAYSAPIFEPDVLKLPKEVDAQKFETLPDRHKLWYQPTGRKYSLLTLAQVVGRITDAGSMQTAPNTIIYQDNSVTHGTRVQTQGDIDMSNNPNFSNITITGNNNNVGSTLTNVQQIVGASSQLPDDDKKKLTDLIEQLKKELAAAPPDTEAETAEVADSLDELVKEAEKPKKNDKVFQLRGETLKQAAENLAGVVPAVVGIVGQILPLFHL